MRRRNRIWLRVQLLKMPLSPAERQGLQDMRKQVPPLPREGGNLKKERVIHSFPLVCPTSFAESACCSRKNTQLKSSVRFHQVSPEPKAILVARSPKSCCNLPQTVDFIFATGPQMEDLTASKDKNAVKSGNKGSSSDPSSDEVIIPEWTPTNRMLHEFARLGKVHLSTIALSNLRLCLANALSKPCM